MSVVDGSMAVNRSGIGRSRTRRIYSIGREIAARPTGFVGLTLVAFHLFLLAAGWILVPYDPSAQNGVEVLRAPSMSHWLGTDLLGRDVLSRTLVGGRAAIAITGLAAALAVTWGGAVGIASGAFGGRFDNLAMGAIDAFLAIPKLFLLLVVVAVTGGGSMALLPTLAAFYGLSVARIARAATRDLASRDFVLAARARGERPFGLVWREMLPNVIDILLVDGAMRWSWMLLAFSSLSFLGLGVAPPTPDWGVMIADVRVVLTIAPWNALAPSVALSCLILGINFLSDAAGKALGVDLSGRDTAA